MGILLLGEVHQLNAEGHHKPVKIRPGHILQVDRGHNPNQGLTTENWSIACLRVIFNF